MSGKSTMIFKLKGLAIFSVICAHMADLPDTANAANTLCANFVKSIGCLGVPVFLLISGYLFVKSTDRPFLAFWKNKAKTIFLPWLLWASIIYAYVSLRHGGSGVLAWAKFVIGVDTPFYYLTSLCILYLIYFTQKRNTVFIAVTAAVSVVMNLATSCFYDTLAQFVNPFLNPVNWMVYFAAGMLIAQKRDLESIGKQLYKKRFVLLGAAVLIFAAVLIWGDYLAYWKPYSLPVFAVVFLLATAFCCETNGGATRGFWILAGEYSFAVYLLHSPVASIVLNLKNRLDLWPLTLAAPAAVFLFMVAAVFFIDRISEKLAVAKIVKPMLGIR